MKIAYKHQYVRDTDFACCSLRMCFTRNFCELFPESISSESQVRSKCDNGDSFKLLDVQLEDFHDKREFPVLDFTVDGYVDVYEDVLTSETHVKTDAEIITRVTQSWFDASDITKSI